MPNRTKLYVQQKYSGQSAKVKSINKCGGGGREHLYSELKHGSGIYFLVTKYASFTCSRMGLKVIQ